MVDGFCMPPMVLWDTHKKDKINYTLPEPLGPMIAVNRLKGPTTWWPLYDLKFSSSSCFRKPMLHPTRNTTTAQSTLQADL